MNFYKLGALRFYYVGLSVKSLKSYSRKNLNFVMNYCYFFVYFKSIFDSLYVWLNRLIKLRHCLIFNSFPPASSLTVPKTEFLVRFYTWFLRKNSFSIWLELIHRSILVIHHIFSKFVLIYRVKSSWLTFLNGLLRKKSLSFDFSRCFDC